MKIAVLGSQGFVGSRLTEYLGKKHTVLPLSRVEVDLLNPKIIKSWLQQHRPDVVINSAATMSNNDSVYDTRNNFGLFMNFHSYRDLFGKFINLGSGAEFDRIRGIDRVSESDVFDFIPSDSYGFGQNMKSRVSAVTDNFYTIRIFNCFGAGEIATRIFPKALAGKEPMRVHDRYFDYFSIQDLCTVVEDCIDRTWTVKDVNAVYMKKYKISQVLEMFCELNNLPKDFEIISTSNINYTGDGLKLNSLSIPLQGLEHGLANYIK